MGANRVVKYLKYKDSVILCHKEAMAPYNLARDLRYQVQPDKLSQNFVSEAQSLNPLHVVNTEDKKLKFFAGWAWYEVCQQLSLPEIVIIEHNDVRSEDIQRMAWLYLLSSHVIDLERKTCLSQLVQIIDNMPKHLCSHFMDTLHGRTAVATVQNLTGEDRTAVRHQQRTNKNDQLLEGTSILASLLGEAK